MGKNGLRKERCFVEGVEMIGIRCACVLDFLCEVLVNMSFHIWYNFEEKL